MKGTRWAFAQQNQVKDQYIFVPLESIKLKYRVLDLFQASCFGESMRIQFQNRVLHEKGPKKDLNTEEEKKEH